MRARFITADVFTDKRFGGNPLAVFPDAREIPPELFQAIAREFNYAETTFVLPPVNKEHAALVRIFSPAVEMPFAGHPTIGTAHVLSAIGVLPLSGEETGIVFEEAAGPVAVTIRGSDGRPASAELTSPMLPAIVGKAPDSRQLTKMLSLNEDELARQTFEPAVVSGGTPFLLIPLANQAAVAKTRINLEVYESLLPDFISDKVFVFSLGADGATREVHARMFAPAIGVPEDPATGSAAVALAGYLAWANPLRTGTLKWRIEQGFEMGRPSLLEAEADKRENLVTSVRVRGATVLVSEGTMQL